MTRRFLLVVCVVALAVPALDARAYDAGENVQFGVVFMTDWLKWASIDEGLDETVGPIDNGSEFRRVRLWAQGLLSGRVQIDVSFDLKSGEAILRNAYAEFLDIKYVGRIRVGHTREPFSIEEMTTSRYVSFMEFAAPTALAPGRNIGLLFHNDLLNHRMAWAAGIFQDADQYGDSVGAGSTNVTARVTGIPFYEEAGWRYLHLGAAYSVRQPIDGSVRYESKPELNLAPWYVDTGDPELGDGNYVKTTSTTLLNVEVAGSMGPGHFQGEFIRSSVNSPSGAENLGSTKDPYFWGFYVQVGYLFTGEHRTYDNWNGAFYPIVPNTDFLKGEGPGAIEIVGRYSVLDLTDADAVDGDMTVFSLAANWYMAPRVRIIVEYANTRLEPVGNGRAFALRFQADF